MPRKVAIEQDLTQLQQYLSENGYEVVGMEQMENCDCCVITGGDQNIMGMQNVQTKVPVINAHGLTAEEIKQQIDARIQLGE